MKCKYTKNRSSYFVGKKIGNITLLELFSHPDKKGLFFKCECDCGKIYERKASTLYKVFDEHEDGYYKVNASCGCRIYDKLKKDENNRRKPGWKDAKKTPPNKIGIYLVLFRSPLPGEPHYELVFWNEKWDCDPDQIYTEHDIAYWMKLPKPPTEFLK